MPSSTASVSGRLMRKRRSRPCSGGDRDAAAQRLDRAFDDIHADPSAGNVGDARRGGEAGKKEQIVDFAVAELRVGRNQLLLDGDRANARSVDSRAVVRDLDDDSPGAMRRRQLDLALGGFARRRANLGRLNAVIDRVADHMGERIGQTLDDGSIDFRRLPLGSQPHRLSRGVGQFADDARHALEQRLHRLGADRHDAFLYFSRQLFERAEAGRHARRPRQPRLRHPLRKHRLIDHQLSDQIDQSIDALEIDADRRRSGLGLPLFRSRLVRLLSRARLRFRCVLASAAFVGGALAALDRVGGGRRDGEVLNLRGSGRLSLAPNRDGTISSSQSSTANSNTSSIVATSWVVASSTRQLR